MYLFYIFYFIFYIDILYKLIQNDSELLLIHQSYKSLICTCINKYFWKRIPDIENLATLIFSVVNKQYKQIMFVYVISGCPKECEIEASQKCAFAYRRASFHAGATRLGREYREYRKGE